MNNENLLNPMQCSKLKNTPNMHRLCSMSLHKKVPFSLYIKFMDTGQMCRGITWAYFKCQGDPNDGLTVHTGFTKLSCTNP